MKLSTKGRYAMVALADLALASGDDLMSLAAPGYMRLDIHRDGQLRLGVIALESDADARLVFSTCIP